MYSIIAIYGQVAFTGQYIDFNHCEKLTKWKKIDIW